MTTPPRTSPSRAPEVLWGFYFLILLIDGFGVAILLEAAKPQHGVILMALPFVLLPLFGLGMFFLAAIMAGAKRKRAHLALFWTCFLSGATLWGAAEFVVHGTLIPTPHTIEFKNHSARVLYVEDVSGFARSPAPGILSPGEPATAAFGHNEVTDDITVVWRYEGDGEDLTESNVTISGDATTHIVFEFSAKHTWSAEFK